MQRKVLAETIEAQKAQGTGRRALLSNKTGATKIVTGDPATIRRAAIDWSHETRLATQVSMIEGGWVAQDDLAIDEENPKFEVYRGRRLVARVKTASKRTQGRIAVRFPGDLVFKPI